MLTTIGIKAQQCSTRFEYYKNGRTIVFVSRSTLPPGVGNNYWNFGDGTPVLNSHDYQLTHQYAQPGKYRVCLTDSSCTSNPIFCDSITVTNTKNVTAKFSYEDWGNGSYYFYDSSTSTKPVTAYLWNFGDGTTSDSKNTKHNYRSSGEYIVSLTILDSSNNYDIAYDTLNAVVGTPCYADFEADYINNEFQFRNLSSSPDTSVRYEWYFGDNSPVNYAKNPTHKYAAAGNYTVTLFMVGATCIDTIQKQIGQPDTTLCSFDFTSSVNYQKVLFTVTSASPDPLFNKYFIDFGDLNQEALESNTISHIYTDTGTYKVCVYSHINLCGIQIIQCKNVRINELTAICKANFDLYDYEYTVALYNSSIAYGSSVPSTISINWGDGSSYSGIDSGFFNHTYTTEATYNVTLTINNPAGCSDSIRKIVSVGPNYTLSGNIFQGGGPAYYSGINTYVYDSATGLVYKGPYTTADENGNYSLRVKKGYYLVQADFSFDPFNNGFYLPTYYRNKLNWDAADVIFVGSDRSGINIDLIPFTYDSNGTGSISGLVKYGSGVMDQNGPVKEGKPAEKMLLYLLDNNGKAVAFTHTNVDGQFSFANVPTGQYKVWGEMAGKQTTPAMANLSTQINTVSGIKIIIGKNALTTSLGAERNQMEALSFNLYPNPTNGILNIEFNQQTSSIQLFDITGTLLVNHDIQENRSTHAISMQNYANGLYLIKVNTKSGHNLIKKVLKTDE